MTSIADLMMNAMRQPTPTQKLGNAMLQGDQMRRQNRLADMQMQVQQAQLDKFNYDNSPENRERQNNLNLLEMQTKIENFKKTASEAELKQQEVNTKTVLSNPSAYSPQEVANARAWHELSAAPDNSTLEVYDPDSPTGTRILRRSDAIGMPGKPGSKTSLTVDPETGAVTFSQGSGMDMSTPPKGAQSSLFSDYVGGQQSLDSIRQIESLYEPEFLTYKGAAKGTGATILNKMDPEIRSQFQSRRAAFISTANQEFLRFRKWATGIAGGEKEMAEIKRATFSEDDSPQDFESKMQAIKTLRRRLNARAKAAMKSGIDNNDAFEEYIKANPLDNIPTLQERGDQLEKMGYKPDQVINILIDEGYIEPGQQ